jgi:hypothetical protein
VGSRPQPAVVQLDDRSAFVEPHAHAFVLGGEERLEELALDLRGQAAPRSTTLTTTFRGCLSVVTSNSRSSAGVAAMASMPFLTRLSSTCCNISRSANYLRIVDHQGRTGAAVWLHIGYGLARADGEVLAAASLATLREQNSELAGGLIGNAGTHWRFGLEAIRTRSSYVSGEAQSSVQLALSSQFIF